MKLNKDNIASYVGAACGIIALLLPINSAISNVLPDADGKDDSKIIVERIKESLPSGGLISIEQNTGRLLFNPVVDKLHNMAVKQKFLMPVIIVNQRNGLKLVEEIPFTCFMLTAGDLASENYKGFRQHETLQYIRSVKDFAVSRALICNPIGNGAKNWKAKLNLPEDADPFIFEEHVSLTGERFFYFLNSNGSFEMYM